MNRTGFASSNEAGQAPRSATGFGNKAVSSISSGSGGASSSGGPQHVDVYAPSYIAEQRKSELNEMRRTLADAINKRKDADVTAALESIIASMTIGMDVSELFNVVIMVRIRLWRPCSSFHRCDAARLFPRPGSDLPPQAIQCYILFLSLFYVAMRVVQYCAYCRRC